MSTLDAMRALALAGAMDVATSSQGNPSTMEALLNHPDQQGLGVAIAWTSDRIGGLLNNAVATGQSKPSHFMPLPKPFHADFRGAFFRPNFTDGTCFVQVVIVLHDLRYSYGLRFEQGQDADNDTHGWSHAQLTKEFYDPAPACSTTLPALFDLSYPAVPTSCSNPCDVWLGVLAALYGFATSEDVGLRRLIKENPYIIDNTYNAAIWPDLMKRASFLLKR